MASILSETFAAGIPGGFATLLGSGGGTTSVTWNSGQQSADLARTEFNGAWRLDACPTALGLRVVLDVEPIAADAGFGSASSFGVSFQAPAVQTFGHHLALNTEGQTVFRYGGSTGDVTAAAVDEGAGPLAPVTLSGRRTWEFVCVPWQGRHQYQVRVDGALVHAGPVVGIPPGEALRPWVFLRDSSYRIHSIDVDDSPSVLGLPVAFRGSTARLSRDLILSGGRSLGSRLQYLPFDGGPYRVAGTVKIDGTPAVPVRRRVRLFHRFSGRLLRETWSAPDGTFEFAKVALDTYLVVADDYTGVYEAEAADRVVAVP